LTAAVASVLVVKLSSLGDVVHAMAAVQDMRRARPDLAIDWVVERAFAPLVARCQGVRRVIPCDLRRWRGALWSPQTRKEWRAFRADLRAHAYDAVIDVQGLTKSALVSWLARTSARGLRYGLAQRSEGSSFEAPARWVADCAVPLEPHVHAVQRARLLCAAALDYPLQGAPLFGLLAGNRALRRDAGPGPAAGTRPVVALVHGSSRQDKTWPQASWVALGQRLNANGYTVALVHGTPAELAQSKAIGAQLDDAWVWPALPLDAVTDTLAQCAGVIGVDSGLSHLAVALDLPHVQIYNFDTAWRTGVQNAHQVCVFAQPQPAVDVVWQAWNGLEKRAP